jgi:hypothetical protein
VPFSRPLSTVAVAKTEPKPEVPVEKNEWRDIPADVNPNDIEDVDVNEKGEIVGVEDYDDSIMVRLDSIIMYYRHSGGATLELEDYMFTFTGTVMEELQKRRKKVEDRKVETSRKMKEAWASPYWP